MRCYSHLSDDEREQIGLARTLGHSIGAIAQAIGRPKSTISRELSRNRLPSGRPDGYKLGRWVIKRRKKNNLNAKQIEILEALGFDWDPRANQWEEAFERLQAYIKEHGDCRVSRGYKFQDGFRLGPWVSAQRHKGETLSPERKARLNALGFDWDPYATDWEKGFEYIAAYVRENAHCRVPSGYKLQDGFRLGTWVSAQRDKGEILSHERKVRLDALGFDWDPYATDWEKGVEHLAAYVRENAHCIVSREYKSPDGYKLGEWVINRRELQAKISIKRKAQLDALGFEWNPIGAYWEKGFHYLKIYKEREGHCRVPQKQKEDGFPLGNWVGNQRSREKMIPVDRDADRQDA
jgi:Helicase associated domain/Helix-turn-helix domain